MAPRELVIVGAGGHGREIFGIVHAIESAATGSWRVKGFIDDGEPDLERLERLGVTLLGTIDELAGTEMFVVGIGDPAARRAVAAKLEARGHVPAPALVHPSATIGPDVQLGEGSVVFAGARVTTNVRVGRHSHLNQGCTIAHDVCVGDFVLVGPLSALSGNVVCGSGVELGTGVSVLPGVTIGDEAMVGAGAVVTRDLPPRCVAVGVPAKPRSI